MLSPIKETQASTSRSDHRQGSTPQSSAVGDVETKMQLFKDEIKAEVRSLREDIQDIRSDIQDIRSDMKEETGKVVEQLKEYTRSLHWDIE